MTILIVENSRQSNLFPAPTAAKRMKLWGRKYAVFFNQLRGHLLHIAWNKNERQTRGCILHVMYSETFAQYGKRDNIKTSLRCGISSYIFWKTNNIQKFPPTQWCWQFGTCLFAHIFVLETYKLVKKSPIITNHTTDQNRYSMWK